MIKQLETTAVFDIGRTNKKFFLFDPELKEVYKVYHRLPYTVDDDGDSCESLHDLEEWIRSVIALVISTKEFRISKLNFTTYGASLVHLNKEGKPAAPLYNYLKKYPSTLMDEFYEERGGKEGFCQRTASPALGMLNSGLQLYWLKKYKPIIYRQIHKTLHLPQFLSYLFTNKYVADYTSLGCHTGMWDFVENSMHSWLQEEQMTKLLPEIVPTNKRFLGSGSFRNIHFGVGIHDSSSALLPYLLKYKNPFVLLSTGTWAISINPFNHQPLSEKDLERDCLQYLSVTGKPVKASRLFIGEEHKYQISHLYEFFNKPQGTYKKMNFDVDLFHRIRSSPKAFRFQYLTPEAYKIDHATETRLDRFQNFEEAYYTFIHELTDMQVASLRLVLNDSVNQVFIDGGFNANNIFLGMLQIKLFPLKILTCNFALGSALGAALMVQDESKISRFQETLPTFSEFIA